MKQKSKLPLANILAGIIIVYLGVLLIQIVRHNYQLKGQVTSLEQQITDLQSQKDELSYKISYYQTDAFKEKEARAKLGLEAPGEGVIVLPKTSAAPSQATTTKATPAKSNWQQWKEFLLG